MSFGFEDNKGRTLSEGQPAPVPVKRTDLLLCKRLKRVKSCYRKIAHNIHAPGRHDLLAAAGYFPGGYAYRIRAGGACG